MTGLTLQCVQPQLAPYGQGYEGAGQQGCAIAGSTPGSTLVDGTTYIAEALDFYQSHMWRNFGIVVALWVFFVFLLLASIERLPAAGSNKAILLYKRGGGGKFIRAAAKNGTEPRDEEEGAASTQPTEKAQRGAEKESKESDQANKDVFAANT